jgi:phage-related protein
VQRGLEPLNWKPLTTIGTGVREIRIQVGRQYRLIYITRFGNKVHILHGFQKKSQKTSRSDIELAKKRLLQVARRYK